MCFDVSGTIFYYEQMFSGILREVVEEYLGTTIDEDELRAYHHLPYGDRVTHVLAMRGIDDDEVIARLTQRAEALHTQKNDPRLTLVPGVDQFMKHVHDEGVNIAIVSSLSHAAIESELTQVDLLHYAHAIVGADDVDARKPHPEPYEKALHTLGISASHAIAFEDSPPGVESAWLAGIPVVGVLTSFSAEELHNTFYTIPDYRGLTLEQVTTHL